MAAAAPVRAGRRSSTEPPDPVTAYALDVVAGTIVAGLHVRRACERHLADLETGAERGLRFDVAAAQRAIGFFPLLRHYKGEWGRRTPEHPRGRPIVLEPWQAFIVGSAFGWQRADGTRRFRQVYVECAKKNGKTLLAAGIAILLAFFDAEPGAEVYSIATKRDQAKLVWSDAARMVEANPSLRRRIRSYALSLTDDATASFFRPLGRDSGEGDQGVNAHGAIIDELHVIEDREPIDNIETATSARRQPLIVKITTAGARGAIVWEEERADALAVVEGRATDDALLALVFTLDEGDDPFDESVWGKANPNLGVSVNPDTLREQAAIAKRSPGRLAAFLRYRVNVPTSASTRAVDLETWDRCTGLRPGETYPEREARVLVRGALASGGLDLASVQDLTAFVLLVRADDGGLDAVCRFWCPEEGIERRSRDDRAPYADWVRDGYLVATEGNVTDYAVVKAGILGLADIVQVVDIGYDRWNATQLATELEQDGARMVGISQTAGGLAPGWRELEKHLLEGRIRHGGHPVLRWMAGNVEVATDAAGNQRPVKQRSAERIDGIVALTMAQARAMTVGEVAVWTAV